MAVDPGKERTERTTPIGWSHSGSFASRDGVRTGVGISGLRGVPLRHSDFKALWIHRTDLVR